jgi:hypothetical protein
VSVECVDTASPSMLFRYALVINTTDESLISTELKRSLRFTHTANNLKTGVDGESEACLRSQLVAAAANRN